MRIHPVITHSLILGVVVGVLVGGSNEAMQHDAAQGDWVGHDTTQKPMNEYKWDETSAALFPECDGFPENSTKPGMSHVVLASESGKMSKVKTEVAWKILEDKTKPYYVYVIGACYSTVA